MHPAYPASIVRFSCAALTVITALASAGCGLVVGIAPFSSEGPGEDAPECVAGPGEACWAIQVGDAQEQSGTDITADTSQNIFVTGWYFGTLKLDGCEPIESGSEARSLFVAKLTPGGKCIWSARLGGVQENHPFTRVKADDQGDIFVTGGIDGSIVGAACVGECEGRHGFLAKLDGANGAPEWCRCVGQENTFAIGLAVGREGSVVFGGEHFIAQADSPFDLGCEPVTMVGSGTTAFVASFDAGGTCLWNQGFPKAYVGDIELNADGETFLTGGFDEPLPSQGMCEALEKATGSARNILTMKLHEGSGECFWRQGFGAPDSGGSGARVTTDTLDNVVFAGTFFGSLDMGGEGALSSSSGDAFFAMSDAYGNTRWTRQSHSDGGALPQGIDFGLNGAIVLSGIFTNHLQWGKETLTAAGPYDAFIAMFEPLSGVNVWSRRIGNAAQQGSITNFVDGDGNILVTGSFGGAIDLGTGPLTTEGDSDIFIAKLRP